MSKLPVRFNYYIAIRANLFTTARLKGSWDAAGRYASDWCSLEMENLRRSRSWSISIASRLAGSLRWDVEVYRPDEIAPWGIMTEENLAEPKNRLRARFRNEACGNRSEIPRRLAGMRLKAPCYLVLRTQMCDKDVNESIGARVP